MAVSQQKPLYIQNALFVLGFAELGFVALAVMPDAELWLRIVAGTFFIVTTITLWGLHQRKNWSRFAAIGMLLLLSVGGLKFAIAEFFGTGWLTILMLIILLLFIVDCLSLIYWLARHREAFQ